MKKQDINIAYETLVYQCANLQKDEKVLVITDTSTNEFGQGIERIAAFITKNIKHLSINDFNCHGQEPPEDVAKDMLNSDVIFGMTKMSMAHTKARLNASNQGAKYLSLPDYSYDVLKSPAWNADFKSLTNISNKIANTLTEGNEIILKTNKGTDFSCLIGGRIGNSAPGWCQKKGDIASPPDSEANIAVLETKSNGIVVVDGSIPCPEIGLLKDDIVLEIKEGMVQNIKGFQSELLESIFSKVRKNNAKIVGEFGIGLNPLAKLRGFMLEDEGCLGTIHLGIGSNATIGGTNNVSFHLDHVVREATVIVDNQKILEKGKLILKED